MTASSGVRVRLAAEGDLPATLAIVNRAIAETHFNFHVQPHASADWEAEWRATRASHPWLVAEQEDAVLGYALAAPYKGRCAYGWTAEVSVYVAVEAQGRGIGRTLYATLIDTLAAQGFRTLIGTIALPNDPSERLHTAFGFRRVGRLARVGYKFGRFHDVALWQRELVEPTTPVRPLRPVADVFVAPS